MKNKRIIGTILTVVMLASIVLMKNTVDVQAKAKKAKKPDVEITVSCEDADIENVTIEVENNTKKKVEVSYACNAKHVTCYRKDYYGEKEKQSGSTAGLYKKDGNDVKIAKNKSKKIKYNETYGILIDTKSSSYLSFEVYVGGEGWEYRYYPVKEKGKWVKA